MLSKPGMFDSSPWALVSLRFSCFPFHTKGCMVKLLSRWCCGISCSEAAVRVRWLDISALCALCEEMRTSSPIHLMRCFTSEGHTHSTSTAVF